jgi:hypothetical protein
VRWVGTGAEHVETLHLMDERHEARLDGSALSGSDRVQSPEKIAVLSRCHESVNCCGWSCIPA